jgi:PAS domain S-box-containing protein
MRVNERKNRRILVIDDNESIHKDFREILVATDGNTTALDEAKAAILGSVEGSSVQESFEIDSAFQGREGLQKVLQALNEGRPYAMAFVDVRMPPGWDGIETIQQIWAEYPQLQVVICTAYSDYQWHEIIEKLGRTDQLLILKKPFDNVEVHQLACAMTEKWSLFQQAQLKQEELGEKVKERTCELAAVNEELKQEITERRRAEEAVRESEEKYRKQFEEAMDAIVLADAETGVIIDCNPATSKLVGRKKTELIGEHQKILHLPEEIEGEFSKTFKQHVHEKAGQSLETQVITKDGEKKDIAIKANTFQLGDRRVIQGTFRDITERKKAEEAIRQSEHFLENVLNSIQDGISVLDPELNIVRVNDAMRLWYSHRLPLEGKKCYQVYHERCKPCEVCPTRRALQTGKLEMDEISLTQADGVTGTLELFAFPMLDDNNKPIGVVEYVRDVTERRFAEEEVKEQDRLRNEFVMNVSHELRTPLTIFKNIISNALAGVMGKISDKHRESLEIADKEIDRIARIINNFLDISKVEAGKMQFNAAPLAIQSVVTDTVRTRKLAAEDRNAELQTVMPDDKLFVNGDRDKISQILGNLIDNAVRFVPGCGGRITIRVKDLDDEVGIDIEDNGPGIELDDVSKVFNRFVQVEKHVGPGSHGTGLGLAICKELVELHGGRIWAENTPTGANFCFVLPKLSAQPPLEPSAATTPRLRRSG